MDVLERLRLCTNDDCVEDACDKCDMNGKSAYAECINETMIEAANEIERLRAENGRGE